MTQRNITHGNNHVRLSPNKSETPIAAELRNADFGFLRSNVNYDGFVETPTLQDWRDAEATALRRIAQRALVEEASRQAPNQPVDTPPTSTDSSESPS